MWPLVTYQFSCLHADGSAFRTRFRLIARWHERWCV